MTSAAHKFGPRPVTVFGVGDECVDFHSAPGASMAEYIGTYMFHSMLSTIRWLGNNNRSLLCISTEPLCKNSFV